MKNGEMKQSKKLLEDIAGIAGKCLIVCRDCREVSYNLSISGRVRLVLHK